MNTYVRFTGLCAFVKNPSFTAMRVVLVDSNGVAPCDTHEAALIVPISHWNTSINKRVPQGLPFVDQDYKEFVLVFPLNDDDLIFPKGVTPLALQPPASIGPCPGSDASSFSWVARIDDFGGDGRMLDDVLKSPLPASVGANVAARIRITSGSFGTRSFRSIGNAGGGLDILKWRGGRVVRPIAEEVLLTDTYVTGGSVYEISAKDFKGKSKDSFILTQDTRGRVRFKIVDLPLDKIKNPTVLDPLLKDECFSQFYKLGVGTPGAVPEPVPADTCPHSGGGLSNPKCPCACFSDNANA